MVTADHRLKHWGAFELQRDLEGCLSTAQTTSRGMVLPPTSLTLF